MRDNLFINNYFTLYGKSPQMRLNVLLNEVNYNPARVMQELNDGEVDQNLSKAEIREITRAITLIEDQIDAGSLGLAPKWFFEDQRFFADSNNPDLVVSRPSLIRNPGILFEEASSVFKKRNTYYHRPSLRIV